MRTTPHRLPDHVAHFVRLLRAAGLPVGPGHTITAVRALAAIDVTAKGQFYWGSAQLAGHEAGAPPHL